MSWEREGSLLFDKLTFRIGGTTPKGAILTVAFYKRTTATRADVVFNGGGLTANVLHVLTGGDGGTMFREKGENPLHIGGLQYGCSCGNNPFQTAERDGDVGGNVLGIVFGEHHYRMEWGIAQQIF